MRTGQLIFCGLGEMKRIGSGRLSLRMGEGEGLSGPAVGHAAQPLTSRLPQATAWQATLSPSARGEATEDGAAPRR